MREILSLIIFTTWCMQSPAEGRKLEAFCPEKNSPIIRGVHLRQLCTVHNISGSFGGVTKLFARMDKFLSEEEVQRIREWLRDSPDSCYEDEPPADYRRRPSLLNSLSFLGRSSSSFESSSANSSKGMDQEGEADTEAVRLRGCFIGIFSSTKSGNRSTL